MAYYIETSSKQSFDKTIETTVAALAEAGFGVLSEIDVAGTLKKQQQHSGLFWILRPHPRFVGHLAVGWRHGELLL